LGAFLIQQRHFVQIIDAMAENLSLEKLQARILRFKPDVIGITTNVSIAKKAIVTAKIP
jgi:hypothetical protein